MLAQSIEVYALPSPSLAIDDAWSADDGSAAIRLRRLADLAAMGAKARAELKDQHEQFEKLYREASSADATIEELEEVASTLLIMEKRAADAIQPQILRLKMNLSRKLPRTDFARAMRRSGEEALDIALTWLELYQNLRIRLLKLASDRRASTGEKGSPVLSNAGAMESYLRRIAEE
jgi:hypothetical protein